MDEVDRAQEIMELGETWPHYRLRERSRLPVGESASECIECGLLISSARQIASPGCQLCVECQADWERVYVDRSHR